ncbi:ATP-grasp domain-containing protein [Patescibacteria group bacterium]|nr:ATP-grasp domain-containing protein [Patescibacteria group bacterium]
MKIALFYRVWFDSGERFLEAAKKLGVELVPVCYQDLVLTQKGKEVEITFKGQPLADFDLFYFRAVGGAIEWANILVLYAQEHQVPVVDEYLTDWGSGRRAKGISGMILAQQEVAYPQTILVSDRETLFKATEQLNYPFVLKVSSGGRHGMGTLLIKDQETLNRAVKGRIEKGSYLLQKYIPNDGDYRIFLIGYEVLAGFKRQKKAAKLLLNQSAGPSSQLEVVPQEVASMAIKAARALKIEICAVDLVVDEKTGQPYVVEANEAPQFKVMETKTGMDVAGKIIEYLVKKAGCKG